MQIVEPAAFDFGVEFLFDESAQLFPVFACGDGDNAIIVPAHAVGYPP
jgi:hypothetical protein